MAYYRTHNSYQLDKNINNYKRYSQDLQKIASLTGQVAHHQARDLRGELSEAQRQLGRPIHSRFRNTVTMTSECPPILPLSFMK
jgi:hypothetical protein